jgi:hypothetical protein
VVHLRDNSFSVQTIDMSNTALAELKESWGIPAELASCHTAEVEGYVIEGHVPVDVIQELLLEKPDIVGLALPGMPPGSPGMGGEAQSPLQILAFDQQGRVHSTTDYVAWLGLSCCGVVGQHCGACIGFRMPHAHELISDSD